MPKKEVSSPRPSGRFCHPLNQQRVTFEGIPQKKNSFFNDQSHYVYENNRNADIMSP